MNTKRKRMTPEERQRLKTDDAVNKLYQILFRARSAANKIMDDLPVEMRSVADGPARLLIDYEGYLDMYMAGEDDAAESEEKAS